MGSVNKVSDATFQMEVLESTTPVLVDFYADWCGPCKMLEPVVEKVAQSFEGKVKFVKINVDDNRQVAGKYGIRGIPMLILFQNGEPVDKKGGFMPDTELTRFLEKHVSPVA